MAIYTFSTKGKRPKDTEAIDEIKAYCDKHDINFSSICIKKLKEWMECQKNTKL